MSTLHFALTGLAAGAGYTLHVGKGEYQLEPHTPATLTQASNRNRAIPMIGPGILTHFAAGVDLPKEIPCMIWVTSPSLFATHRLGRLAHASQYIPRDARRECLIARRQAPGRLKRGRNVKLELLGIKQPALGPETSDEWDEILLDLHDIKTAADAAALLVVQHAELATQHGPSADLIAQVVENSLGFSDLAQSILDQTQAHESDPDNNPNWVTVKRVPARDLFKTGNPTPEQEIYTWSEETVTWLKAPMKDSLRTTKNLMELEGRSWSAQRGTATISVPNRGALARPASLEASTNKGLVQRTVGPISGVLVDDVKLDDVTSTLTLSVTNRYLRWLQISVQFFEGGGANGGPGNPLLNPDGSPVTQYLGMCSAVNTILAIPLPATPTSYSFAVPAEAGSIRVCCGGIGSGPFDVSLDGGGVLMTTLINYAIPSICIGLGVAMTGLDAVGGAIAGPVVAATRDFVQDFFGIQAGSDLLETFGAQIVEIVGILIPSILVNFAKESAPLATWLTEKDFEGVATKGLPFASWIFVGICVVADGLSMVETTVEVASSPATIIYQIDRCMDIVITALPDENNAGNWPEEATHYLFTVTYNNGTSLTASGTMSSTTQSCPIEVTISDAPVGGQVSVTAYFYSKENWISAKKELGPSRALPNNDKNSQLLIGPFHVEQQKIPLGSATRYTHKQKLGFVGDRFVWQASGAPPTATVTDLNGSDLGNNLGALGGLTFSQSPAALGLSWQASGQNVPAAGQTTTPYQDQIYTFQNIGIGSDPNAGLKQSPVGYTTPQPLLAYGQFPNKESSYTTLLEPSLNDQKFFLRAVSVDASEPFVPQPGMSYGWFAGPQDTLRIHPSGFAIGLNRRTSKLQVLALSGGLVEDARAPRAEIYAGLGTRQGLLQPPVGLAIGGDGTIYILMDALEESPPGIAAFDVKGNYLEKFGGPTPWRIPLKTAELPVDLLDVAVESLGYLYVLKVIKDPQLDRVPPNNYLLDIYTPDGKFLSQTSGFAAGKLAVTLFRYAYTLNYEEIPGSPRTQPSVSEWLPSIPE